MRIASGASRARRRAASRSTVRGMRKPLVAGVLAAAALALLHSGVIRFDFGS